MNLTAENVVVLVTPHIAVADPEWASHVNAAIQRGVLKRVYLAFITTSQTPAIIQNLADRLRTCRIKTIRTCEAYTLTKVTYRGELTTPQGQAA